MTTPQDPRRHPLQDDEVELARVLRALPTGEPSSKVDAAILAAAADAVAAAESPARPRKRVRVAWALPTWAIGTAAAAVLAIGVGSQLLPPLSTSGDTAVSAERAAPRPAASEERLDVDLIERKREYPPTSPPPPPPPPPAAAKPAPPPPMAAKQEAPVVESAPAPAAFPEPSVMAAPVEDAGAFAPPPQDADAQALREREEQASESRLRQSAAELNRVDAARRAQARQLEQLRAAREDAARDEYAEGNRASATAAAPATAPAPAPAAEAEADATLSDRDAAADAPASQAGTLGGALQPQQALPPVASDTTLAPTHWIARIRDRLHGGDRDGALASLKLLRERHPDLSIPADLEALD